jgi:hypothetical protein
MKVTTDLGITNIDSIKLQATTLAQLTEATNELTRTTSVTMQDFFSVQFYVLVNRCSPRRNVINLL